MVQLFLIEITMIGYRNNYFVYFVLITIAPEKADVDLKTP